MGAAWGPRCRDPRRWHGAASVAHHRRFIRSAVRPGPRPWRKERRRTPERGACLASSILSCALAPQLRSPGGRAGHQAARARDLLRPARPRAGGFRGRRRGAHSPSLSLSLSLQQSLWKHTTGGARRPRRRGVARSECGASDALATASPRVLVIPALWGLGALFRTLSLSRSYHELPASHSLSGMAPPGDVVLGRTGAVLGQTARQRHDPDDEGAARGERRAGELGSRCPRLQCG